MPQWTVRGTFLVRRGDWQSFAKSCEAPSPDAAKERVLSQIGGCHGVPRTLIRIQTVTEAGA